MWPVMVRWLGTLLRTFRSAVRTRRELALENLALRQQLAVWQARQPRPRLTKMDRIFWILLSRLWTSWRDSVHVVRPETVVRWHRQGFRRYWAGKRRHRRGRPAIGTEVRDLIRRMSRVNPLGSTSHARRPPEAGPDGLAGDGFEVRLEYTFPATCSPTSLPSSRTTRLTASSSAAPANPGPPATA